MLAFAPGFNMNDPSYAMLMQGSEQYVNNPYYPWQNMHSSSKGMPMHPAAHQGMSTTLAPAVLENNPVTSPKHVGTAASTPAATSKSGFTTAADALPSAGLDFNFSQESKEPSFFTIAHGGPTGSGHITPAGEGFWDNFVTDGSWEDGANESHLPASSNPGSVGDDV